MQKIGHGTRERAAFHVRGERESGALQVEIDMQLDGLCPIKRPLGTPALHVVGV